MIQYRFFQRLIFSCLPIMAVAMLLLGSISISSQSIPDCTTGTTAEVCQTTRSSSRPSGYNCEAQGPATSRTWTCTKVGTGNNALNNLQAQLQPQQPAQTAQTAQTAQSPNTQTNNTPTGGGGDLQFFQILPFNNVFELLDALAGFLRGLATPLAILVIIWGGYQYFFGGFSGKADGMKTIQAGVIGLIVVVSAGLVDDVVRQTFTDEGLDPSAFQDFLTAVSQALIYLSAAVATLVIVWGGYQYFFGGFSGKADGMKTIQAGVIGLIVVILAGFIVSVVNQFFGDVQTVDDLSGIPDSVRTVLEPIIRSGISFLSLLAGAVAVLVIMWGGYQYFFSSLPGSKADGKDTITKGVIGLVVVILAQPLVVLVQGTVGVQNQNLTLSPDSIIYVIQVIVTNFLIPLSSVVSVFFFVLGAYQWISASGDSGKVKKAQDSIRNAIIGLIVVLLSTTFTQLIIYLFRNNSLINTPNTPQQSQTQTQTNNGQPTRPSL